jgi:AcrR family transcriptional regulator
MKHHISQIFLDFVKIVESSLRDSYGHPMARTSQRKADLIVAAQRAIAQHGAGVQLNQIASMAGVSSSAVLYHYPNIEELLVEANRAGMERFYNQRLERIAPITDPAARLMVTISLGVPEDIDDEDVRLLCALGGEAARNTLYAVLLTSLFDRQVEMYRSILELGVQSGAFRLQQDSLTVARNLVALEDAYGYRIMAKHPTLDYRTAVDLILDYARLATDNPLIPQASEPRMTQLTEVL